MVEEIVEKQRSDSLASEGAEDAEAEDIGDRGGQRVGRRKNVLILLVATHSGLDLGHDKTHDPSLRVEGVEKGGGSDRLE